MTLARLSAPRIAGISTCVPANRFDNLNDATDFSPEEVRKIAAMAGITARRVVDAETCSTDLCHGAARDLLGALDCDPESIDALIMVTQTPDYLLPTSACLLQDRLGLTKNCAAFDINLGCSGYVYGLWVAAGLLANSSTSRVLLLHGETPTRYVDASDRSVALLFGDAGSATLLESSDASDEWSFVLRSDGSGYRDLIVEGGGFRDRFPEDVRRNYVHMNGSNVFNFTISVLPPLIADTLEHAGLEQNAIDYYILHQSNQFMKHIVKKTKLDAERVPVVLKEFGNVGGPSVPLTITQGGLERPEERALRLMLLGYGVGLSWGSAVVELEPTALLRHCEWSKEAEEVNS